MADLNYYDIETLRPRLVERVKESVRKFLLYTQGGGGSPSQTRVTWCTANLSNVAQLAEQLSHYVTSEPTFRTSGTSITDAEIQSRVETVLETYFMPA